MKGTAFRTPLPTPEPGDNDEAIYAVFPPAEFGNREATQYVFVTACPDAGDTQVLPCTREGYVLNLLLLGHVVALDHAAALRAAGYELEEDARVSA